jgi:hypothetical protein
MPVQFDDHGVRGQGGKRAQYEDSSRGEDEVNSKSPHPARDCRRRIQSQGHEFRTRETDADPDAIRDHTATKPHDHKTPARHVSVLNHPVRSLIPPAPVNVSGTGIPCATQRPKDPVTRRWNEGLRLDAAWIGIDRIPVQWVHDSGSKQGALRRRAAASSIFEAFDAGVYFNAAARRGLDHAIPGQRRRSRWKRRGWRDRVHRGHRVGAGYDAHRSTDTATSGHVIQAGSWDWIVRSFSPSGAE